MSTQRTTRAHLEAQVSQLNKMLGLPQEPWTARPDGKGMQTNVGNLHLDHNLGGWRVEQMFNESGGVTCPLGDYRYSVGEMWHVLKTAVGAVRLAMEAVNRQAEKAEKK